MKNRNKGYNQLVGLFILSIILFSCVGIQNASQRTSQLSKKCKKMIGKPKSLVISEMTLYGFDEVIRTETLTNGEEVHLIQKSLINNNDKRYYDRVLLVFEDNLLIEYEIRIKN